VNQIAVPYLLEIDFIARGLPMKLQPTINQEPSNREQVNSGEPAMMAEYSFSAINLLAHLGLAALNWLKQSLFTSLTEAAELQVRQTVDRRGQVWWHVYDPITGVSIRTDSETNLKSWIEQRY
jgi:hypothetical protein